MKKAIFGIAVLTFLFATSCKKTSSSPAHFWAFEGVTYPEYSALGVNATSINPISVLSVLFPSGILPTANGTYTVINPAGVLIGAGQVGIELENGPTYRSTGGNGNQTVSVTVSGGKIFISGSNITLQNEDSPYDSAALNFNIAQTQ